MPEDPIVRALRRDSAPELKTLVEAIQRHHDERYGPPGDKPIPYYKVDIDLYEAAGVKVHGRK
jgi:hypothetical protein